VNSVRIDVLGSSFTVQTDEDPAYFAELLAFYRSRIDLVESQTKIKDPARLSALAALLIADELFKLKDDPASRSAHRAAFGNVSGNTSPSGGRDLEEAERIALRLIADIEEKLPGD
jgi:cell division protein ZapA (FtsZ GTPase activity inhibitor)